MTAVDRCFALFDDDDGGAVMLSEYRRTIRFDGGGDLASVFSAFSDASAHGEWVALAADYELGACFEHAVARVSAPGLCGWVFGRALPLTAEEVSAFLCDQLKGLAEHDWVAGVAELQIGLDAEQYGYRVEQIRRWIADGECYQINLTFPLDGRLYGHPLALYSRLRKRQPVRYGAYLATPERTLLSFSPELFFERTGSRVVTRPMKGTAPRGASPQEDETRRRELLASDKERAENVMIVDLLRNDLGRLAAPGRVRVDSLCEAEAYPTLWQVV